MLLANPAVQILYLCKAIIKVNRIVIPGDVCKRERILPGECSRDRKRVAGIESFYGLVSDF
jgi:hypothetical protein